MKIIRAELFEKKLPLKEPFEHATSGRISELEEIFVKLTTDDGHEGFGEVRGNCMYFTGDCSKSVEAVLMQVLLPELLGEDPMNRSQIFEKIDRRIVGNTAAKAAIDIAVHDLAGKCLGIPVYQLLGGLRRDRLETEENIPFCSLEETVRRTETIVQSGCRFIKVRVGMTPFSRDLERLSAISETVRRLGAEETELAIDANQAWGRKEAAEKVQALYPLGVKIVEQPVAAKDLEGLKYVREHTLAKVFADEAVFTPRDFAQAIAMDAVDGLHIKLIKSGGITNAMKLCTMARESGLSYMIGGMDEGMMAVAAAVQCAAAADADYHELDGHRRIANDVTSGLIVENAMVQVPKGSGLGVRIQEDALDKLFEIAL